MAPATMNRRLLVIDDDQASCRLVEATFRAEGFDVRAAHDGASGLKRAAADRPDLVLLDLRLPDLDGLHVLEQLKGRTPHLPVVMLTASRDVRTAVRATQLGAFDYLTKPIDTDEVVVVVRRALETSALQVEVAALRQRVGKEGISQLAAQMGTSAHVTAIVEQVSVVAASHFTVLVLGETGTGKELVAQAIHTASDRRNKPFVALDCGAIPEALLESELFGHERGAFTGAERRKPGRFQLAQSGTCFLDEVGNLPITLQVKLLRVLESRQVQPLGADRATPMDVRFVAATNHDLQSRVAQGVFRGDLYFRVAEYTISLPPLRDRVEDIEYLTHRFMQEASVDLRRPIQQIAPAAVDLLMRHRWPGNVRELRNVVRQAVLQTTEFLISRATVQSALAHLTAAGTPVAATPSNDRSLKEIVSDASQAVERQAICEALRATGGNQAQAARALRTDYKTLYLKIRRYGIRARDFST
jgi:DNA-binding NtrC family response regulator